MAKGMTNRELIDNMIEHYKEHGEQEVIVFHKGQLFKILWLADGTNELVITKADE